MRVANFAEKERRLWIILSLAVPSRPVFGAVGVAMDHIAPVSELWNSRLLVLDSVAPATATTFMLLCCWELWKHRNGVVFRGEQHDLQRLLAAVCRVNFVRLLWCGAKCSICNNLSYFFTDL
jgi:hypothetical protein